MLNTKHLLATAAVIVSHYLAAFSYADVSIEVDLDKPGPEIHKNVYGQFMEHLGRGIYEGIWVGEDSSIPNTNGYRKDVVKALKDLHVPLLRWPGGCFADEYHWRNGIGPREQRPVTINTTWGGVPDDNSFGTHEFFGLAELLDAEVYVNGNLGTGTAREMAEWLEYMTADGKSSLAQERKRNGREKPWRLHYFAIGNESWGCGGTMTPQYYADLYKHYATFAKAPADNQPIMIASGGHTALTEWTETLITLEPTWSYKLNAIAHHYYTLPTGSWEGNKGAAIGFPEHEWFDTMKQTLRLDGFIQENLAIMDKHDPEKKVGFYVDEWGTWYDTPEGENPGFLYQQNSIRDAVLAAVNLNMFHKYAERIQMTNIAQMVNVLQAMILTDKEKMLLTPTYHVFKMHVPFQGAKTLDANIGNMPMYTEGDEAIDAISVSFAKSQKGKTIISLANLDPNTAHTISLKQFSKLKGEILTANTLDAHNTFEQPNNVKPEAFSRKAKKGSLEFTLPAKSVLVAELK